MGGKSESSLFLARLCWQARGLLSPKTIVNAAIHEIHFAFVCQAVQQVEAGLADGIVEKHGRVGGLSASILGRDSGAVFFNIWTLQSPMVHAY
jgi:hypothetical protein